MEDDVRTIEHNERPAEVQVEAAYRGFLFADLRGYTAFVERHGDSAAADLLDAYRELVRAQVAGHAGAEIRTEGDSFYVVFGSARRAVACGLAIVAAAERASRGHPERPVSVGIGINAGETVQRGESFVGTAVNLAARVCAQARAGEVLITAAVRDALGATPELQLVPKGTRRLKGITRPVALFAVRSAGPAETDRTTLWRQRSLFPIAAALIGLPFVIAALWIAASAASPGTADTSPSPAPPSPSDPLLVGETAGGSPAADPSAIPNAAEASLLAALGEDMARHCESADEDDRPVMLKDDGTAEDAAHDGIACDVPSVSAPDTFYLWVTRQISQVRVMDVPRLLLLNKAGRLGIPRGDCSDGGPALEEWQLGDVGGSLLCFESSGDAIIEWSYRDRPTFGRAVRRDGDLGSLLAWWVAEARLLNP